MKTWTWLTVAAISAILPSAVSANTIIDFVERAGAVDVFIDGTRARTVTGESADTVNLTDPGLFKGPLGRRACLTCPTGVFGAVLFQPGTTSRVVSDFIVANVVFGVLAVDSDYSFASDPDILALARKFQSAGHPNLGLELLDALTTKAPKTSETGEKQVLQFFDLNGVPTPLPSGLPFPPFFTGGDIVITATSDISEVPEPATLLLFGTTMAGLGLTARWRRRRQS